MVRKERFVQASIGGGGSAGGGGYNFQAQATAFIYAHVLAGYPMSFVYDLYPVPMPVAVSAESGGPGDDVRVECEGGVVVEIQVKRGLQANTTFYGAEHP